MRALLVNTRHFPGGGDSTYAFNLAGLLRQRGHEVAFFAMKDQRNLPDPNEDLFVSHIDYREINRSKSLGAAVQVISRAIYSLEARQKFSRLLDRFCPDVVHLQSLHGHITPSVMLEAKSRGLPVLWTLHDYKLVCPNTHFRIDTTGEVCEACGRLAYYRAVQRRCKKGSPLASAMAMIEAYAHRLLGVRDRVDAYLAPSRFLQGKLLERGYPRDRVLHLPYVLPDEQFEEHPENRSYILFLAKLEPLKGIYPLLEAARMAPEVSLVLAGRAEPEMERGLAALLPSNARYVGMKQGGELRELLRGAAAVVLPSIWYENQPLSILEAFACGKPVITSELGGMTELVGGGERGYLARPSDAAGLAAAMRTVVERPEEARARGQRAYEYVVAHHSGDTHYAQLSGIYAELLGIRSKRSS